MIENVGALVVTKTTSARPDRYGSKLMYLYTTKPEEPGKTSIAPTVLATANNHPAHQPAVAC